MPPTPPQPPPEGVAFPLDAKGTRATTASGKAVWAAAARALGAEGAALAQQLTAEKDWRHKYDGYATRLTELQAGPARSFPCQSPLTARASRVCSHVFSTRSLAFYEYIYRHVAET